MSYKVIGVDGKTKVFSDDENLYVQKTPEEIFAEKKLAYDISPPTTRTNKKGNKTTTIPVPKVGTNAYKRAVKQFTPVGYSPYKKTETDINKITSTGFEQTSRRNSYKMRQNEIKNDAFAKKTSTDAAIERQRQDAMMQLSKNEYDVKEKLQKTLSTPIESQGAIMPIPYTASGMSSEAFNKIGYQSGKKTNIPSENIVTKMGSSNMPQSLTAPATSQNQLNSTAPAKSQNLGQLNQTNNSVNEEKKFQMPNTSGLTFGGT